ncbi:ABC transporter ATP-binding protein [Angustibacter sp. Root456]|uniref:ABC transporter ATP-binding protein n=1 Tax=Angustibacter sp. Root456 TaxID=1736539 RepID=UPI0006F71E09|nr:ABC transporter ATP-binding protein [Angustibacter sp. Root456]KQX66601.1 multidrug ABC transporter ATP-binding protein [Angustibacter sp. Root456]
MSAISTTALTKRFRGGQIAVDQLDLDVPEGTVYGFLGPNGSGKTTTIRMVLGLIAPTSGEVSLLGAPMPAGWQSTLPRVGALIEGPACYPFLTGAENLERLDAADATAAPRTRGARIDTALERVGLTAARDKRYRAYSLGMRQRLGIAAALLRPRDLLVLDEPTNGLDPQGTREVRALVRELAHEGTTVFVSSHLLAEVEQICTHAAVLSRGRLVADGEVERLRAAVSSRLVVTTPDASVAGQTLERLGFADVVRLDHTVSAPVGAVEVDQACAALVAAGVRVQGLVVERPSLEDAFVALTGEGFDVAG